jgi:hypothetical protein
VSLTASDPDGEPLTYTVTGLPGLLTVNPTSGIVSGVLSFTSAALSPYTVTASVSDGEHVVSQVFTWTVTNVNRAPTMTPMANQTTREGASVSLPLTGSDLDGDALTYGVTGLPASLTVNPTTGVIAGTLPFTSAGSYSVTATASDGRLTSSQTFTWTVTDVPSIDPGTDFDLNGSPDLLWQRTDGTLVAWAMQGTTLTRGEYLTPSAVADPNWRIAGVADFNRDGWPDLLWQHRLNGGLAAWFMRGTTMVSATLLNPAAVADPLWKVVGVADFNADGSPDLLWEHQTSGGLVVWFMNGTSLVSASWLSPSGSTDLNWKVAVVADFDADGKPDLLWQNKVTGGLIVWFMNASLTMTRAEWLTPSNASSPSWKVIGAAHMNADSYLDLVWQHQESGELVVWYMNGLTLAGASYLTPTGVTDQTWRVVAVR